MFKEKLNNLIAFISKHKKVFAFLLGVGLFIPFLAFAIDFSGLFTGLISWALKLPLMITRGAAHLAITLFQYVTDPSLTSLSYTNPVGNPIIELGLEITRPFANLAIVFFLILIGLATAINYKSYQAQQLLPKLVAVAILVNFIPLAAGAVIDAANIVTFYFFENIGEGPTMIQNRIQGMGGDNIIPPNEGRGFGATQIYGILTAIAFNILIAWTFFIYAFIFLFRYVYIWTLVILSPLAFVAWVIPATKDLFKKWWSQFISWAFIGVPAGFFLYIGLRMLIQITDRFSDFSIQAENFGMAEGIIQEIFPSAVVMLFLWFGSKQVRNIASSTASVAVSAAGAAVSGGATAAAAAGSAINKKFKETSVGKGAANVGESWQTTKGNNIITENFHRYATRPVGKKISSTFSEEKDYHKTKSEVKGKDVSDQIYDFRQGIGAEKYGAIAAIVEDGNEKEAMKKGLTEEDMLKALDKALSLDDKKTAKYMEQSFSKVLSKIDKTDKEGKIFNKFKDITTSQVPEEVRIRKEDIEAMGDEVEAIAGANNIALSEREKESVSSEEEKRSMLAEKIQKERVLDGLTKKEMKEKGYRNYMDKIVANLKDEDDIKRIKGSVSEKKTIEAFHRHADGNIVSKAVKTLHEEFVDNFSKGMKDAEWYTGKDATGRIRNRDLAFYLQSSGASKLGLPAVKDKEGNEVGKKELREMIQKSSSTSSAGSSQGDKKDSSQKDDKRGGAKKRTTRPDSGRTKSHKKDTGRGASDKKDTGRQAN